MSENVVNEDIEGRGGSVDDEVKQPAGTAIENYKSHEMSDMEEELMAVLRDGWRLKRTAMGRLGISQYRWYVRAVQTVCQFSFFPLLILMVLEQHGVLGEEELGIGYVAAAITLVSLVALVSLIDLTLMRTLFHYLSFTMSIGLGICVPVLVAICTKGSLRAYLASGFAYGIAWPLIDCMDLERVRRTRKFLSLMMLLSTVGLFLVVINVFKVNVMEIVTIDINGVPFSYSFRSYFIQFASVQIILGWKQIIVLHLMTEVDYYFASKPIRRTR